MKYILVIFFFLTGIFYLNAQNLDDLLDDVSKDTPNYTTATFKSSRIINSHSIEQMKKAHLDFRISHRFGTINSGIKEFFGIDQSTIHLSLEYGLTDRIMLGIGRSSYQKTYDGFIKLKLLKQSSGSKNMPFTLSYLGSSEIFSSDFRDPESNNYFSSRISYVNQLLLARKFNEKISFQLSPTHIHKNLVPTVLDMNDLFAIGIGGRYKFSKRVALMLEYFYNIRFERNSVEYNDPISIGFDIETGGHVFQLMITNTPVMREGGFIYGEANGNFFDGDIHFGFNISRTFSFDKEKTKY